MFMTEHSLKQNMTKLFGYKQEFFATRFYLIISNGIKDKRIFFPQYMNAVNVLIHGGETMKMKFVFQIYDIDGDDFINGYDIVQTQSNIVPSSIVGQEVEILSKYYVERQIREMLPKEAERINLFVFSRLVMRSCLIDEIKQRILSKPRTEWTFNCFESKDSTYDAKAFALKQAYYKEKKMYRQAKHVTWSGLGPIEDDDLKQRKKLMKDAPKGAEDENVEVPIEGEEDPDMNAPIAPTKSSILSNIAAKARTSIALAKIK